MVTRARMAWSALLVVCLLLAIPSAASAVTRATGEIDGSGTSYTLTVQNTGDQPIQCMRFFAASGVQMTSVSPPGTLEGPGVFSAEANIPVGGSRTFSFTTTGQYPPNAGGTLNVSTTCSPGSDVSSQVTGPPPPLIAPLPCQCAGIGAALAKPEIRSVHGRSLNFRLRWALACSPGPGNGCRGRIKLQILKADGKITSPKKRRITCNGKNCNAVNRGSKLIKLILSKQRRPLANELSKLTPIQVRRRLAQLRAQGKFPYPPLRILIKVYCLDAAGKEKLLGQPVMTVKFDKLGQVNRKRSDLNGNGFTDGRPVRRIDNKP